MINGSAGWAGIWPANWGNLANKPVLGSLLLPHSLPSPLLSLWQLVWVLEKVELAQQHGSWPVGMPCHACSLTGLAFPGMAWLAWLCWAGRHEKWKKALLVAGLGGTLHA